MKLLIVAGGGGHFAPALAVIEKLPKDWDVLLVGRKYSLEGDKALSFEYQTAQNLGIPFKSLTAGRLQRKFTRHTLSSLLKFPIGVSGGINVIREFRPDVVLSFGGYVSVPIVLAASFLKVPIVVHEQILGAGAANKLASYFARKICVSWDESRKFFPEKKTVLTGNPIRRVQSSKFKVQSFDNNLPVLYITGGSAGAHAINDLIGGCVEKLLESFNIIHQTGDAKEFSDFDRLSKIRDGLSDKLKSKYLLRKFLDPGEVFDILKNADLVVGRSGINTVFEIMYFGVPAFLIPLPFGQKNEQLENAEYLKNLGLSEYAEQRSLTSEKLFMRIITMHKSIDDYKKNGMNAKKLIIPNAADKIIEVVNNAKN
jgi:UDP-N-acetylglucosamine--N-acetylmuramyl-(pentapeptide) pyrophosphoryl-undecaprenol N-acetylglucosamine transferase